MNVMALRRKPDTPRPVNPALEAFLRGYSIEVMPRTAAKVEDFRALLPKGTRVYVAHIDGTPFEDMLATAKRLTHEGFDVMPHFPARIIRDRATLAEWIERYRLEAGVHQALLLAGGVSRPQGEFSDSMQLLDTGLFEQAGFTRLHVAGHPEGNRDIDPDGGHRLADAALLAKQEWAEVHGIDMKIITQFVFEATPVIDWAHRIAGLGIRLPVRVGLAGPARLQTLIRYAIACGVGPSLTVLQRRAKDLSKLLMPFTPDAVAATLARHVATHRRLRDAELSPCPIEGVHLFPLGGISTAIDWARERSAPAAD